MKDQNKRAMERSKKIREKNNERIKKLVNAPVEVKRRSAKINLMVSIIFIGISIVLFLIDLKIVGQVLLVLGLISLCVNLYLIYRYRIKVYH